ncbi:MAG: PHP domain-containing protein [Cyanobacteria bacterium]|nr:PHP domain-containing protein [Cyanobacteriota bacterium]
MKLDTHVHTVHSGRATVFPFNHFMRESYNTPQSVYTTARRRGMDLITVTDHDEISGALALGVRHDVITGCEVTAEWPDIDLCVHVNVLDITPAQHGEIQRLRGDVRQLMPYLNQARIYTSLNHVASGINGPLTAAHLAAVLPWVDGLEVINGTRLPLQNRTAMCLAAAAGKHTLGGGDSHTGRGIGLTWTEVPGARSREEFMQGLRAGRGIAGGAHGGARTMMSDMWRFAGNFMSEAVTATARRPGDWRGYAFTFGGILGLPIVPVLMAAPFVHFVHEQRFNRDLLYDLIARPESAGRLAPSLAA